MPTLKTRNLFISHAWSYEEHYKKVIEWFDDEPDFSWKNYSVPSHDACAQTTNSGLKTCLTNQMSPAQGIIILAGMYTAYSGWIEYEIDEAVRMGKIIIGIKPWGSERTPQKIQDTSAILVGWKSASVIKAVRDYIK